jgi:hypothetical protein
MAAARVMALAAMTESPIAVTCLPVTFPGLAEGAGVPVARLLAPGTPAAWLPGPGVLGPGVLGPEERAAGEPCAWVAALTRSPSDICRSIPAGAAA